MTIIEKRKSWLFIGSLSFIALAINGVQGFAHYTQNNRSYQTNFGQQQRAIAPQITPQSITETPTASYTPANSSVQEQRTSFIVPQERTFLPQPTSFEAERPVSVTELDSQQTKVPRVRELKQQPLLTVDKMFQKDAQASVTNVTPTIQTLSHQTNSSVSTDESKMRRETMQQVNERASGQTNFQNRPVELVSKKESASDPKREDRPTRTGNTMLARGKAFQQSSSVSKPVATEPKVKTDMPKTAAMGDTTPSQPRTFLQKIFSPPQEQPIGQSSSQPQPSHPITYSANVDSYGSANRTNTNDSYKQAKQPKESSSYQQPKPPKENNSYQPPKPPKESSSPRQPPDNSSQPKRKK